jgi:hypothetical protein
VDGSIGKGEELRPQKVSPAVRVVLAEAESPGALHYLLEAEGFQVVGCASSERDLMRVLAQDVRPDAIVFDQDITVTSVAVAKELAPAAQVIVIWPDGVQPLAGTRRVSPRLVYEELGPAIRLALETPALVQAAPVVAQIAANEFPKDVAPADDDDVPRQGRTAARSSVVSIALVAAIVLSMGAVFAVGGMGANGREAADRTPAPQTTIQRDTPSAVPTGNASQRPDRPVKSPVECGEGQRRSPNQQAADAASGAHGRRCPTQGGGTTNKPAHPEQGQGDHATGQPDDAGQSGDPQGQSGDPQGQSDGTHGQSADTHGQSGQHGAASEQHGSAGNPT